MWRASTNDVTIGREPAEPQPCRTSLYTSSASSSWWCWPGSLRASCAGWTSTTRADSSSTSRTKRWKTPTWRCRQSSTTLLFKNHPSCTQNRVIHPIDYISLQFIGTQFLCTWLQFFTACYNQSKQLKAIHHGMYPLRYVALATATYSRSLLLLPGRVRNISRRHATRSLFYTSSA